MRLTGSRVYTRPSPVPRMPPGLVELMEGLTKDVLKNNPTDVYEYCAAHVQHLLQVRDGTPLKKCLTLEQKIAKAQGKVRQRAKLRHQNYDKELKLHSDCNLRDIKEGTNSSEMRNELIQETDFVNILRAPVHHEQDLTDSSEVEISQEKIDSKKNESYTREIKEEFDENEGDTDAKIEQNISECLSENENIDTANYDDPITGPLDKDSNSFESSINDKGSFNVVQDDRNNESVGNLIELEDKHIIDDDCKISIESNLESASDAVNLRIERGNSQMENEQQRKSENATQKLEEDIEQHSFIKSDDNNSVDKSANGVNEHEESHEDEIPTNIITDEENREVIIQSEEQAKVVEKEIIQSDQKHNDMKDTNENNYTPINNHPKSTVNNIPVLTHNKNETVIDEFDVVENNSKSTEMLLDESDEGNTDERNGGSTENKNCNVEAIGNLDNDKTSVKSKSNESLENRDIVLITENDGNSIEKSDDIIIKEDSAEEVLASEIEIDSNEETNLESCDSGMNHHKDKQETTEIIKEPQGNSSHLPDINLSTNSPDITETVQFNTEIVSAEKTSGIDDITNSNIEIDTEKTYDDTDNSHHKSSNMDLETAAITIQKVFRSFLFKSRASTFDDTPNDESNLIEEYVGKEEENEFPATSLNSERRSLGISRMDTVLQTVNEEKSLSLSTDDSSTLSSAATTIQAHVRGFLVRNKLNSNKTLSTNSLVNSEVLSTASLEDGAEQHKKTVLNIHIVPEGGHFMSRDESMVTSVDLPFDGSPPSSTNLHPLGYDKSERRKQLKREDAVQSISPPSNNSGKLSEDSVKEIVLIESETTSEKNDPAGVQEEASSNTSPSESTTVETVIANIDATEPSRNSIVTEAEYAARKKSLTKMSSDEMDVVTPFVQNDGNPPSHDTDSVPKLLHSGEFHDVVLPTKVMRNNTSVVRGE